MRGGVDISVAVFIYGFGAVCVCVRVTACSDISWGLGTAPHWPVRARRPPLDRTRARGEAERRAARVRRSVLNVAVDKKAPAPRRIKGGRFFLLENPHAPPVGTTRVRPPERRLFGARPFFASLRRPRARTRIRHPAPLA